MGEDEGLGRDGVCGVWLPYPVVPLYLEVDYWRSECLRRRTPLESEVLMVGHMSDTLLDF